MTQLDLIAACAFGLEAVVGRELAALGYEGRAVRTGGVEFAGDAAAIARANLWLRTADRVLVRLGSFPATDFGQLFDGTRALAWETWIGAEGEFPVGGRSIKSQLSSVPACQRIVKKAIVERLRSAHGVELLSETGPKVAVEVSLVKDVATLTLDTTGPSLHKRGYRTLAGGAPLKETLAAALVLLSFWTPERPLVDPFCGSGTIPIEAALIGRNLAPGMARQFAAEAWPALPEIVWTAAREEARQLARGELPVRIIGTDADADMLSRARYHAERAGVAADVHFQQRPFAELSSSREFGCMICNPPYGERMSDRREVEELYRAMPVVLRRLKTWSHYVLTSHPEFERVVGQQADRRRKLYNGRIECTYFQFYGPKPAGREGVAAGRSTSDGQKEQRAQARSVDQAAAFGGLSDKGREQAELFRARLAKRARHLRRWPSKRGITCYRLYDRDIPEVPLVVDRYEDHLHLAEYQRPHEHTPAEHADWLDLMVRTAGDVLEVPAARVYLKRRERQRGDAQYQRRAESGQRVVVGEGGLKFYVNFTDYLDTGLFLDHRAARSLVRDAAAGRRVLNLFGYTGTFSVYAAAGSAAGTTTVDLSPTYLDWARDNMMLNGLDAAEHRRVQADAMSFLAAHPRGPSYELAVVDPPTFSNSKRTGAVWDIQRDHAELLGRLLELMAPGGIVFFSTNSRRFRLDEAALGGAVLREISRQTVPEDFRNRRVHRCWRIVCSSALG